MSIVTRRGLYSDQRWVSTSFSARSRSDRDGCVGDSVGLLCWFWRKASAKATLKVRNECAKRILGVLWRTRWREDLMDCSSGVAVAEHSCGKQAFKVIALTIGRIACVCDFLYLALRHFCALRNGLALPHLAHVCLAFGWALLNSCCPVIFGSSEMDGVSSSDAQTPMVWRRCATETQTPNGKATTEGRSQNHQLASSHFTMWRLATYLSPWPYRACDPGALQDRARLRVSTLQRVYLAGGLRPNICSGFIGLCVPRTPLAWHDGAHNDQPFASILLMSFLVRRRGKLATAQTLKFQGLKRMGWIRMGWKRQDLTVRPKPTQHEQKCNGGSTM